MAKKSFGIAPRRDWAGRAVADRSPSRKPRRVQEIEWVIAEARLPEGSKAHARFLVIVRILFQITATPQSKVDQAFPIHLLSLHRRKCRNDDRVEGEPSEEQPPQPSLTFNLSLFSAM